MKTFLMGLRSLALALGGIVAFLAICVLTIGLVLRGSLPQIDGAIAVRGATAPVRIVRDSYGVPHIEAQSLNDALFGLGFVHGQDRLWQMELTRRIVQGRVAEIAGPPAVTVDIYLRSLGLYRSAESATRSLSPEATQHIQAYVAGVNAAMRTHRGALPPEFTLAQITPEAWSATDSVATVKSLALQLSANAFREAMRVRLLTELTPEQLDAFHPPFPRSVAAAWNEIKALRIKTAALDRLGLLQDQLDLRGASNNWVVSGARSASGKPIVANDPHLGMTLPSIWYLARLTWPGGEAVGGTIPGIPGLVTGRTRNVAFGLTTTGADTQDIYFEKLDPQNTDAYLTDHGRQAFKIRHEKIKVRFGADRDIIVRETTYGPVIPDADPRVAAYVPQGTVAALRWPALDPVDRTIETSLKVLTAKDASEAEVRDAFSYYRAPLQSWVYAGIDGSIGKLIPGPIPIRDPRQTSEGKVPSPGWLPGASWLRLTEYSEWPHFRNAPEGWYATANNQVVPDNFPHRVANEWDSETRFNRISQLLAAHQVHSVETFKAMQRDVVDDFAVRALPLLIAQTTPTSAMGSQALNLLRGWNGAMTLDRPQPLIFAAWMRQFVKQVMADEMKDAFSLVWNYWPDFTMRVLTGVPSAAQWCDDVTTAGVRETCSAQLASSLDAALTEVQGELGPDLSSWRWGAVHIARLSHIGLGQIPFLNELFNLSTPVPGGANTIDRADHRLGSSTPFAAVHGAGFRGISDLGRPQDSVYVIAGGQSGNVYSTHYSDIVPIWARGDYLDISRTPDPADPKVHVLILSPDQLAEDARLR